MKYLGREVSPQQHQVGDRIEINGHLREVVELLPCGYNEHGHPLVQVITRPVTDLASVPAPVRWGLRCLAAIAGARV